MSACGGIRICPSYSAKDGLRDFDRDRFNQGLRSSVFPNAPPGLIFTGDDAMPGQSIANNDWWNFAPRVGVVCDPQGEGLETLRASYGRLYDLPHMQTYTAQAQMSPWGNTSTRDQHAARMGRPVGRRCLAAIRFRRCSTVRARPRCSRLGANYTTYPLDLQATRRRSVERQLSAADRPDWMVSANYLGNVMRNVWTANQINPAVFGAGATVANTNQRRQLLPAEPGGRPVLRQHPGARSERHLELSTGCCCRCSGAVPTGSRCRVTTPSRGASPIAGTGARRRPACRYMIPGDRESDRGRCPNSPEHSLNASVVYQMPAAGSGVTRGTHRRLAGVGDSQRAVRLVLQRDHRSRQRALRAAEPAREPGPRRSVHARPHVLAVAESGSVSSTGERHLRDDADRRDSRAGALEHRYWGCRGRSASARSGRCSCAGRCSTC